MESFWRVAGEADQDLAAKPLVQLIADGISFGRSLKSFQSKSFL